jgi:LuxR family transcriptional regulator, maltose regulon positive regulatory protein
MANSTGHNADVAPIVPQIFLSSKLNPPHYNIPLIERGQLLNRLNTVLSRKVVLVHAPAGFGKTTLLYQWFRQLQGAEALTACWLSLDSEDQDATRFLYHLLCSIKAQSDAAPDPNLEAGVYDTNARLLKDEVHHSLAAINGRVVLLLDDYHLAETAENNRLLETLIGETSIHVSVVLCSRYKPDINFAYFKCQGHFAELGIDQLRFTEGESSQLFHELAGIEQIAEFHRKTEGWPVVLQLAKLWLLENRGEVQTPLQLYDDVVEIADYLSAEILKNLPDHITRVLIETAILDQINGDLANYITERSDCWEIFQSLRKLDALVVSTSAKGGWFRYHNLFSDFLLARLSATGGERVARLHRRASDWFCNHGNVDYAVKHSLKAGDPDRAVAIIEEAGATRIALTGGMPLLRKLLQQLDAEVIYRSPRLHLARIWMLAKEGKITLARALYDDFLAGQKGTLSQSQGDYSDLAKESLFVSLMLTEVYEDRNVHQDEVSRVESIARDVSLVDHWFQGWINNLLCIMHVRRGNLIHGMAVHDSAMHHYQQVDSRYGQIFMRLHLSIIHYMAGRLGLAEEVIGRAHQECKAEFPGDMGLLSLIAIVKASLLFERHQLEAAAEEVFSALDVAEKAEGWVDIYVMGYRTAALIALASGDLDEALVLVERAAKLAGERQLPRLHWHAQCLKAELLTLSGQIREASHAASEQQLPPPAECPFATWREKHLSLVVHSRLLIYQGKSDVVVARLLPALQKAESYGRQRLAMELSLVLALAYFDLDDRDRSVNALRKALHLAVAENFRQAFINEGVLMARMLKTLIRHVGVADMANSTVNFLAELLAALTSGDGQEREGEQCILSEKEMAVLAELAKGNVNKIIARNLDLSLATVKFHLGNIYQKLGVSSRVMAVAVAKKKNLVS